MTEIPIEETNQQKGIGQKIVRGTFIVVISDYFVYGMNFIRGIILARLISPEAFGIFTMADFFKTFLGQPVNVGFDQALIYRQDHVEEAYNGYYLMINAMTFVSVLLTLLLRPFFLIYYDPAIYQVLVVLMLLLFIQTLGSTPITYLRKNLLFGRISTIVIISSVVAFASSVYLASRGFEVWALVAVSASTTICITVLGWLLAPWRFAWRFDQEVNKSLLKFGSVILLGNFAAFFMSQFDDFLVGHFTSLLILGYYSKAYGLAQQPLGLFSQIINKVSGPLISAVQNDPVKLSRSFNFILALTFKGTLFLGMVFYIWAPEVILLLIGEKWLPMVPFLRGLLLFLVASPIWDMVGTLLTYVGRPKLFTIGQSIQAALLVVIGFVVVQMYGALGMAIVVSAIVLIITAIYLVVISSIVQIRFWDTFVVPILAMVLTGLFSQRIVGEYFPGGFLFWMGIAVFPALIYAGFLFLLQGKSLREDIDLLYSVAKGRGMTKI